MTASIQSTPFAPSMASTLRPAGHRPRRRAPRRLPSQTCALAALALALFICLPLSGCRSGHIVSDPRPELSGPGAMAILGFTDMTTALGTNANIRCPVTGHLFMAGPVPPDAPEMLGAHLYALMDTETDLKMLPLDRARRATADGAPSAASIAIPITTQVEMAAAGRSLGAQWVMAGHVYRFKDRVGGPMAASEPASVAFDIHLIRSSDGRLLWSGYFDETQHSLSENLFRLGSFLEREMQWVTAWRMAEIGMKHVIEPIIKEP